MAIYLLSKIPDVLFLDPFQQYLSPTHQGRMQVLIPSQVSHMLWVYGIYCLLQDKILPCSWPVANDSWAVSSVLHLKVFCRITGLLSLSSVGKPPEIASAKLQAHFHSSGCHVKHLRVTTTEPKGSLKWNCNPCSSGGCDHSPWPYYTHHCTISRDTSQSISNRNHKSSVSGTWQIPEKEAFLATDIS